MAVGSKKKSPPTKRRFFKYMSNKTTKGNLLYKYLRKPFKELYKAYWEMSMKKPFFLENSEISIKKDMKIYYFSSNK